MRSCVEKAESGILELRDQFKIITRRIPMTHTDNNTQEGNASQETFETRLREKLQEAVRTALITVLEAEVDAFIGAVRYERSEQRPDYRNGHYTGGLDTGLGHISDLAVPPHGQAIRRSSLSAIIADAVIWIKRLERWLLVESVSHASAR
jgi:hypothetical protein